MSFGRILLLDPIEAVPSVLPAAHGLQLFGLIFSLHNNWPQQQRMNGALGKVTWVPRTPGAGGGSEESRAGRWPRLSPGV